MAYKICENCGSRVFEHGCVNCNEMEYISMQEEYIPPLNPKEPEIVHGNEAEKEVCEMCGKETYLKSEHLCGDCFFSLP